MAQENGRLPPSQIDSAMPGAGVPLGEEGEEIEIEQEEIETPDFDASMVEVQEEWCYPSGDSGSGYTIPGASL
jgi:hypothetical protein